MSNIAIITARSGSKGLKDKNIRPLLGKPLLAYSIEAGIDSNCFDEIMVSTDSEEYSDIAKRYGAHVPFLRSEEMSGDSAGSWDTVIEVLSQYKKMGKKFDTVTLLQPTSPLRTAEDICEAYNYMKEKKADSITSVCEMEHSPLWSNTLPEDMSMKNFIDPKIDNKPRQELPVYYRENGAIYIRKIEYKDDDIVLLTNREYAFLMPQDRSIDIDTILDFSLAEVIIKAYE